MKANRLELIHIGSVSEPIKEIAAGRLQAKLHDCFPEKGFAAAYLDDKVLIGRWESGNFIFSDNQEIDEKYIQKIRVFNTEKEFLAWRTQQGFNARLRKDDVQGSGADIVVAHQVLVGTKAEGKGRGFTEISEQRGTRLVLPFENIKFDKDGKFVSRICIKTHNYIGYNYVNQATYIDCRFAAFTDGTDCLNQQRTDMEGKNYAD